jgi:hypothetical protein
MTASPMNFSTVPAMALEDRPELVVITAHRPPRRLRVEPFAERRRPREVGEEHGHRLPNLARRLCLQRSAAHPAEAEAGRVLPDRTARR